MMYNLVGFLSLDARYAGFVIPVFSSALSNASFVQVASDGFLITSFSQIEIEIYDFVRYCPPPIQKVVGESCLLGFNLNDEVLFGDFDQLKEQLKQIDKIETISPFSQVDLFAFTGDEDRLAQAIDSAKSEFMNKANADMWERMERKAGILQQTGRVKRENSLGRDDLQIQIDRLIEDPRSGGWYRDWRKLWSANVGNVRLLNLARWWTSNFPDQSGVPQVLLTILADRHRTQGYDISGFINTSMTFLDKYRSYDRAWGNLWIQTVKRNRNIPSQLLEAGVSYLSAISDSEHLEGRIWARVWKRIRSEAGEEEFLADLAQKAVPHFSDNRDFVKIVLVDIIKWRTHSHSYLPAIAAWLSSYSRSDNNWPTVYLAVIDERDFPYWKVGTSWLSLQTNLRGWITVWRALMDRHSNDEELVQIARDWLKRSDRGIGIWPKIMAEVLRSGKDNDEDLQLAVRWLSPRMFLQKSPSGKGDIIDMLDPPQKRKTRVISAGNTPA